MRIILRLAIFLLFLVHSYCWAGNATICSSGCDYTTLFNWEAGEDGNITAPAVGQITEGFQDTASVTIGGFNGVNATNYIKIYTASAARHDGKYNTGKYRLETENHSLSITEDYVTIDGIQIKSSSTGYGICVHGIEASNEIKISNCIIWGNGGGGRGISIYSPGIAKVWNCVIYGFSTSLGTGIRNDSGATISVYNSTISSTVRGIWDSGSATCVNTVSCNNTSANYDFKDCDSVTYCASDDTVTGTGNIDWDSGATDWANVFVDYANGDFHLNNFTGTGKVIGMGTDNPGSGLYSDDIDGDARSSTWDIGADEYVTSGGTCPQIIMIQQ